MLGASTRVRIVPTRAPRIGAYPKIREGDKGEKSLEALGALTKIFAQNEPFDYLLII